MEYKLSILGKNFYKEIELTKDWPSGLSIGTSKECQMRFAENSFITEFILHVKMLNGQWMVTCEGTVYLEKQDSVTGTNCYLMPGDKLAVKDFQSKVDLFSIEFSIDFVNKTPDFNRVISCEECAGFTVGGMQGCTIRILDPVMSADSLSFSFENGNWILDTTNARFGVMLNGFPRHTNKVRLCERDIISVNGFSFYWHKNRLFTSVETDIVTDLPVEDIHMQKNHLEYPRFVRSARQQFVIPEEKVDILAPKGKPQEPEKNLMASMIPMFVSMGMMAMMRVSMGGGMRFILMSVGMGLSGLVVGIINYNASGKKHKRDLVKRENDYNRYISEMEEKIQELRMKESIISAQKYPSLEEEIGYVRDFDARLFEKKKDHEDYLFIRLGTGIVESSCEVTFKKPEYREYEDILMDYPERIHDKYLYNENMPVTINLAEDCVIGFIGDRTHLYQIAKNIILQLCIEHYYQDMKLYLLMGLDDSRYFEWARWFRNFNDENGLRNFAYDEESNKVLFEYVYEQLSAREKMKETEIKELQTIVVLVYRSDALGEHPISNYFEKASDLGFVFIFFEEYEEKVNQHCSKRIFLHNNQYAGYIQDIEDGEKIQHFNYPHISMETALKTAVKMSCVYVDEVSLEASLTKNISLYQLLNIYNVYDLDLKKRWENSKIYDSMAAPLGVKSGDEIVYLDLHEKYHGPHGLVAGTTGSGKSEILQSYILSMATLFHPYEVGFIIIDFKGGGMVNQFRKLPHLNGAITNIDGKEIDRSLASIKAELRKRQRYFAEYEVNHINEYIRLYKDGKAKTPLPHLILIVDEFAELKSDQPEFMKELISAARIGRSLGVHLILATQKPSGVVNDQIWSNSKFKLCLKVQNQGDSNEVLKSPLAAEIREPGRAYLQVGNNEIFQLFQSAYSGAPVPNGSMGLIKKFNIAKVDLCGRREIIYQQKPLEVKGGDTQLDAIVDYVEEYCKLNNIERLPDICLPSLPTNLPHTLEGYENKGTDICIPIGMYDDPDNQYQGIMDLNFTQGHILAVGSSQMGKTNLLQNMVRGLAMKYTSDEVQIYLLDFASMILRNFEKLKHVGDVIVSSDEEKLKNFFKKMEEELDKRKNKFAELGLSSFSSYREAELTEFPQIIIMLDNIGVFRELYGSLDDKLLKLAREGAAVGICIVISALQSANLGFRYLSNFPKRFALYCNDSGEYSSVFDRCRTSLNAVPGRCLLSMDKTIYEGQIYVAFPAEKEIERVKEIRAFIEEINQKDAGSGPSKIPSVPKVLTMEMMRSMLSDTDLSKPYMLPLGMNCDSLDIDTINISNFMVYGVSGSDELGRLRFVSYSIDELLRKKDVAPINLYIIDNDKNELNAYKDKAVLYTTDAKKTEEFLTEFFVKIRESKGKDITTKALDYVVINSEEIYGIIGKNERLMDAMVKCMVECANCKFTIAFTNVKNASISWDESSMVRILKNSPNFFVFSDIKDIMLFTPDSTARNKYKKTLDENEMYIKCGSYFGKYKIPLQE